MGAAETYRSGGDSQLRYLKTQRDNSDLWYQLIAYQLPMGAALQVDYLVGDTVNSTGEFSVGKN